MMRMLKYLLIVGALLAVQLPLDSNAYKINKTNAGKEIKWSTPSERYSINSSGGPSGSASAIQAAAETWSSVETSEFTFIYAGTSSAGWSKYDGTNVVDFGYIDSEGTVGQNNFWYDPQTGEMLESDIRLNTYYSWSTTGASKTYDVQEIATHEMGHSLALDDLYGSSDIEKTMYGYSKYAETKKRSLHQDDIDGITYLYPALFGSLTITISPQAAIDAGARWRVDGGSWLSSGATIIELTAGQHTLEFNDIENWTKPATQTVNISGGQLKAITGSYFEALQLSLTVTKSDSSEDKDDWGYITVTRAGGDTSKKLIVTYNVSGTATNGKDYRKLRGKVRIPANSDSATITVKPKNDKEQEDIETVTVTLTEGQSDTLENQSVTINIDDND